jgi:Asp-tRNA(Asn)/Glu-tRNA(Gln) amidotransferase A subunit family amidase
MPTVATDTLPPIDSSRRAFLASVSMLAAASQASLAADQTIDTPQENDEPTAGGVITAETIEHAQRLTGITFTSSEREAIAQGITFQMASITARQGGPPLPNGLFPATTFNPVVAGHVNVPATQHTTDDRQFDPGMLPDPVDIAFASVRHLSHWLRRGNVTSTKLTSIYLDRLERYGDALSCVITVTADLAMAQAAQADRDFAKGHIRSPLQGIPWGAKDLLDTRGIATTWGATPYRDRIPQTDAAVVGRLESAGAVLVAKLTLGALAYGDIWFGGTTKNPFDVSEGSSGSSAGPAAATSAGLVGFSIGSETCGSIVSPCMRCGAAGLRPTFGRVPRDGAMALCWSLDKLGPICRSVDGTGMVLEVINGRYGGGDPCNVQREFASGTGESPRGLRVGFDPAWFKGEGASDGDRAALSAVRALGCETHEISLPSWPYESLFTILMAEAAAAFESLTRENRDDEMVWQEPQAWPNSFRSSWFLPAVEYVQAQRFRRQCMEMMAREMSSIDAMLAPGYAGNLLILTNATGHPSLTFRSGFKKNGSPLGTTLIGRLFDEGTLLRIGRGLERALAVADVRPAMATAR